MLLVSDIALQLACFCYIDIEIFIYLYFFYLLSIVLVFYTFCSRYSYDCFQEQLLEKSKSISSNMVFYPTRRKLYHWLQIKRDNLHLKQMKTTPIQFIFFWDTKDWNCNYLKFKESTHHYSDRRFIVSNISAFREF